MSPRALVRVLSAVAVVAGGFLSAASDRAAVSPRFEDYPVPAIYRATVKPPDFGKRRFEGADLHCFGDDPPAYAEERVNFAGHFVLSACSCGSGCHFLFMWDAATGKFYEHLPPGVIDVGPYESSPPQSPGVVYQGEQYRPDSSLLIVEGCVEDTCDCARRYYHWTGSRFNLILRQPVRMPARCLKK